ncbi:RNA-binding protein 39 [Sarcoptes scabiei]|nr:RNA-binding protein 39 [Sarcoptes scabiei]
MAEDFDVEALLEGPVDGKMDMFNGLSKKLRDLSPNGNGYDDDHSHSKKRSRSREHKRHREKDKHRKHRSRSSERGHRRSKSRSPSRHSKNRSKHRSRSRDRVRSKSRERHHRLSKERYRSKHSPTPTKQELTLEERDQRTVFCMQLAARVRHRDIEDFFSKVGKVREVRLIMDNRTRRHKGIAYVEFFDINSVGKAIALTGTRLCGVPIVVQHSQAEKNRLANLNAPVKPTVRDTSGPMSLYVGSLHFNINEEMLRGIFEPFGRVEKIELARDSETNRSKGYGFIHFKNSDDAKKAIEQLNGFELAGRPMKVNYVTERSDHSHHNHNVLDTDELDRTGIDLGATGRLQLMARLAEGTGIQLPKAAVTALQMSSASTNGAAVSNNANIPVATQCFLLSNMFDPKTESNPNWPEEIKNDVIEECRKHGGVTHIYVDPVSNEGHVYVKCATISSASSSVNALHGRWFAGRMITAAFVPVLHYHNLFPESATATNHL